MLASRKTFEKLKKTHSPNVNFGALWIHPGPLCDTSSVSGEGLARFAHTHSEYYRPIFPCDSLGNIIVPKPQETLTIANFPFLKPSALSIPAGCYADVLRLKLIKTKYVKLWFCCLLSAHPMSFEAS